MARRHGCGDTVRCRAATDPRCERALMQSRLADVVLIIVESQLVPFGGGRVSHNRHTAVTLLPDTGTHTHTIHEISRYVHVATMRGQRNTDRHVRRPCSRSVTDCRNGETLHKALKRVFPSLSGPASPCSAPYARCIHARGKLLQVPAATSCVCSALLPMSLDCNSQYTPPDAPNSTAAELRCVGTCELAITRCSP